MKQEAFEKKHQPLWDEMAALLETLEQPFYKRRKLPPQPELPGFYRQVCNHYALARSRRYSPALVDELHHLVMRGHQQLYSRHGAWLWRLLAFVAMDFPRALRRNIRYFALALALFLIPALLVGAFCYADPELIYSVMDDAQVAEMESMYAPDAEHPGRPEGRNSETDFVMFGFYISNNIGIGFRTFASGILLGIGTLFTLLFNGVMIGGVAGHLTQLGYTDTFWPFVSGHSSLELTAIVICGAAGLMLGHAVIAPGQYRRVDALKERGQEALKLVMGAAIMLLGAAFIEAFWSSSSASNELKFGVAAMLWLLMLLYFIRMGREA